MSLTSGKQLILTSAAAGGGGYAVSRSLRFNSADSSYLSRTPASAGNRKTWTWAGWVKRSGLSSFQDIWGNGDASALNGFLFRFDDGNKLDLYDISGSVQWRKVTTQVFRDASAWYHFVISYNTANATAADRVRIYVNGVRIDSFSSSSDPSLNYDGYINNTNAHSIGRTGAYNGLYLNGYLADIHFIDGQALDPTSFGEFSETTGVWVPKAYSGTYSTGVNWLGTTSATQAGFVGGPFEGVTYTNSLNNVFDGSTSTAYGAIATWTLNLGQTISGRSSVKIYVSKDSSASISINGTTVGGGLPQAHYLTAVDVTSLQPFSSITFNASGNNWARIGGIEANGAFLLQGSGFNSFHLDFADNSAATAAALGKDTSGNENNWTPSNLQVQVSNSVITPATNAPSSIDYLVIGGGGGGGSAAASAGGGGGGAGGYLAGTLSSIASNTAYSISVGTGGALKTNGNNSVFHSLTAIGGGRGGTYGTGPSERATSGGSGGGGNGTNVGDNAAGSGTSGQGFAGAAGDGGAPFSGGGGGGAGGPGGSPSGVGGNGGAGLSSSITGTAVARAGGGAGGGGSFNSGGSASAGGGTENVAGTDGTGGGGGAGAAGGSGVVILRYSNTFGDLTVGNGLTYSSLNTGGYKIYIFTASSVAVPATQNDSLVDVPTNGSEVDSGLGNQVRGNYCTLNPLDTHPTNTLSDGNLRLVCGDNISTRSSIGITSGKWYCEFAVEGLVSSAVGIALGSATLSTFLGGASGQWSYIHDGRKFTGNSGQAYGSTYDVGDVIGIAFDADAGSLFFYKNGIVQNSGVAAFTGLTSGPYFFAAGASGPTYTANFGQRPFAYPLSGFKALCTANLPAPVVTKASDLFDVKLYTGNGSTQTISGLGFSPDLVWLKARATVGVDRPHQLFDTVRGAPKALSSNRTDAEDPSGGYDNDGALTAFTSDGFTVENGPAVNSSSSPYVAWTWDAGSSTVTNTQGSISSQVRANASAGFSVVTYTGTGANATVGHGLGVAPFMFIVKNRDASSDWDVYHGSLASPATNRIVLQSTAAAVGAGGTSSWNSTSPTSTVVSLGSSTSANASGNKHVMYCFAPVAGYSSFGSYTGNGSSDGPFVYTGFRPRWVMIKCSSTGGAGYNWYLFDSARQTYNVIANTLTADLSDAEFSVANVDFLSNGFKLRNNSVVINGSGATFIYAAFAESPFAANNRAR